MSKIFFRDVFNNATVDENTTSAQLETYIEYWHTHNTGTTLQEFLCMTDSQYAAFLQGNDRFRGFLAGEKVAHNQALVAFCTNNQTIVPGDKVIVRTEALRLWGGQMRAVPNSVVETFGTVMQISFEKNFETGGMMWHGEAFVSIPIEGSDTHHDRLVTINKDNCRPA